MNKDSQKIIAQNRDVYDKIASLFASTRQKLWDDLEPLRKYAEENFNILDLGCGSGRLYHLFDKIQPFDSRIASLSLAQGKVSQSAKEKILDSVKDKGFKYIGLDQSEEQIKIARKNFPNNKFVVGEMTKLPFEDNSFDVIYCVAAFHHLPDEKTRLAALQEMRRVLKPNSRVIMTNWNLFSNSVKKVVAKGKFVKNGAEFMVPWLNPKGEVLGERYYHGFTMLELEDLSAKTGFEIEDQYFSKRGKRMDVEKGHNIISVWKSV